MGWIGDSTGGYDESELHRHLTSPIFHVDPGDPPTFLAHGSHDQFAPLEQSQLLMDRLAEKGVPQRQDSSGLSVGAWRTARPLQRRLSARPRNRRNWSRRALRRHWPGVDGPANRSQRPSV